MEGGREKKGGATVIQERQETHFELSQSYGVNTDDDSLMMPDKTSHGTHRY
jgi:hypothetical protein